MEPLRGGAPVAKVVMFCDDHTGPEGLGADAIGELKRTTLPLLESAAMSTADASKAIASVPATFGASVNVDTSSTDHVLRLGTVGAIHQHVSDVRRGHESGHQSRNDDRIARHRDVRRGQRRGGHRLCRRRDRLCRRRDGLCRRRDGLVVVVTGLVVVVTGFVVVVTGFVVVVTGLVVVVTGLVVVVTGLVVVVTGGGADTVTLPGVPVTYGTGSAVVQPTGTTSMVLFVVRKATVAENPETRMLGESVGRHCAA